MTRAAEGGSILHKGYEKGVRIVRSAKECCRSQQGDLNAYRGGKRSLHGAGSIGVVCVVGGGGGGGGGVLLGGVKKTPSAPVDCHWLKVRMSRGGKKG